MLPNPEHRWRSPSLDAIDRAEIERRLGPISEPIELLSGGLANVNVRIGEGRVLRIFRRDSRALGKEAALLRRPWHSFRVPALLSVGADFLVLEYVPHGPLQGSEAHGAAVGRALAEIHAATFATAGFLSAELAVEEPMPDFVSALQSYILSQAGSTGAARAIVDCMAAQASELRAATRPAVLLHGDFKASNLHATDAGELLVLDWEFAYAGPALMDVGQLMRWAPPAPFCHAFAASYRAHGGHLPDHDQWPRWAELLDLGNLIGLLHGAEPGSQRAVDVERRIAATLARWA